MNQIALLFICFYTFFPSNEKTLNKEALSTGCYSIRAFPDIETIYTKVDNMPLFGDCSNYNDPYYKNLCSLKNIRTYIDNEVAHYPIPGNLKNDTKTYISYTINKEGVLINPHVKLSCGIKNLDNLALNIIRKLKNWDAGFHKNKAVNVKITSVIVFKK